MTPQQAATPTSPIQGEFYNDLVRSVANVERSLKSDILNLQKLTREIVMWNAQLKVRSDQHNRGMVERDKWIKEIGRKIVALERRAEGLERRVGFLMGGLRR